MLVWTILDSIFSSKFNSYEKKNCRCWLGFHLSDFSYKRKFQNDTMVKCEMTHWGAVGCGKASLHNPTLPATSPTTSFLSNVWLHLGQLSLIPVLLMYLK